MKTSTKTNEDARVVKTKAKLISVFEKLLSEKKFEEITVNEICEKADVRRATFYKHYTDKYSFFAYFVENLRYRFEKKYGYIVNSKITAGYLISYVEAAITFLEEHEAMLENVLNSEARPVLADLLVLKNYEITLKNFDKTINTTVNASAKTVSAMLTSAIVGAILSWLIEGREVPRETLISEISAFISTIIE